MIIRQALKRACEILASGSIEDPALEAELLLRHALKIGRVQLYLGLDEELHPGRDGEFRQLIQRRLKGEPVAHITRHREFYGLDFYVDSNVLIPRPETELLVEKTIELARYRSPCAIADIGTGSGAIAVSLALSLPQAKIYATDISTAALRIASINCQKHGVADRITLLEGDMLDPLPEPVDLIIANLPYVRQGELAEVNTHGFEPAIALDGGADGLDKIRRLCLQVTHSTSSGQAGKLRPGGSLFLEIGPGQAEAVTALLCHLFPSAGIEAFTDLAEVERVVEMTLRS